MLLLYSVIKIKTIQNKNIHSAILKIIQDFVDETKKNMINELSLPVINLLYLEIYFHDLSINLILGWYFAKNIFFKSFQNVKEYT